MSSSESLPSVKSVQSDFSTKEVTGDDTQSTPLDGGYGWGLCAGTGIGLICIPSIAILPQWFSKKISLANGICSAGAGIGGLIICFSTKGMLDSLGLAWSLRITAAVAFSVNLTAMLLIRSRDNQILLPAQGIFNFHLRSYHVLLLLGWSFVIMFGFITLMFSLSNYASTIGSSERDAAMVPAMLNLGAAIGRPVIGFASDYYGRVEVAGILTFTCGVLVFVLWIPTTTYGMLLLFAVVGGTILGIFWAVICPLATEVVGLKKLPAFLPIAWLSVVIPSAGKSRTI
ncbi:putative mfs transporter protein [Eutypa lata UCREL1]|uniref:Putative mfs transporter protein n=1 Tax=Eutypa lata (strain UCR-EL1) TaxID=1287681 RepID=M7T2F5_EUTLA|nr:putative mfs transporter protein [Eutypa lata UCREL1]